MRLILSFTGYCSHEEKMGLDAYCFIVLLKSLSLSVLNLSTSQTCKNLLLLERARNAEDERRKQHD